MEKLLWQQESVIKQSQLILSSFEYWFKHSLFEEKGLHHINGSPEVLAKQLFEAPFPVFSHGTEVNPIYNYGNKIALELWERNWNELIKMPSRLSAENVVISQEKRQQLLEQVNLQGYVKNSQGIRISKTGKRYYINDFSVWNLIDESQTYQGQAATFSDYHFL